MNKIKHAITVLLLVLIVAASAVNVSAMPLTQLAAKCPDGSVLTFPAWYKGLQCEDVTIKDASGKTTTYKDRPMITKLNDIWIIALNVVEALIGAAAYIAVGYIIWGGFKYMKSRGDPGQLVEAKNTITQAVIGLGVALASTAMVIFVQGLF